MRIAVSVDSDDGLDSAVAQHFGRCPFFALLDVQDAEVQAVEVVPNPFYGAHQPGQVPGFIQGQSVDLMIARGMGGRAIQFFQQLGVEVQCGASGTVRDALDSYAAGTLQGAAPCRESVEHGHGHEH